MPRVEKRVARKDYPNQGISKGDTYYYTKIKQQRGGIELRSLKPFKPSQLTTSPFKGAWLGMIEDWEASDKDADAMRAAKDAADSIADEERGKFDNLPQGLQESETGEKLDARATAAEELSSELDNLIDELEGLEEPVEPLGDLETDEENESAQTDYEEAMSEYESEKERIVGEADDLIQNMPD